MKLTKWFLSAFLLIVLFSCSSDPFNVDISESTLKIKATNFNQAIAKNDKNALLNFYHHALNEENNIYGYEIGYCLQIGKVQDTAFLNSIQQFKQDPFMGRVERHIAKQFSTIDQYHQTITNGFKRLKIHIPDVKVPKEIVYMNSVFNSNAFCTDQEIGVGLERYLGAKTDVIKELPNQTFFEWIKEGMEKQYLERDAICSWIETHLVENNKKDLADAIIRWGKILYLTEAALPDAQKNIILRYTTKDYQWAIDNEFQYWQYLVNQKLLFKYNERDISNMLNDAPFTAGLPEKGPDRLGQFLGWRMVHQFMEKKEISIQELINTPYNEILQEYEID